MLPKIDPTAPHSPVVLKQLEKRASNVQLRVADAITAFAGSMRFVYIQSALFAIWMLVFEKSPWPTLTLIVSLEAIFLSTFVMIGQNRQAAFQQAKADHDYAEEESMLKENTDLTRTIHELTQDGAPEGAGIRRPAARRVTSAAYLALEHDRERGDQRRRRSRRASSGCRSRRPRSSSRPGAPSAIQRHRPVRHETMLTPMIAAHATCTDGIAESCAGPDLPNAGYTACPNERGRVDDVQRGNQPRRRDRDELDRQAPQRGERDDVADRRVVVAVAEPQPHQEDAHRRDVHRRVEDVARLDRASSSCRNRCCSPCSFGRCSARSRSQMCCPA